jgi:hypothetical protein
MELYAEAETMADMATQRVESTKAVEVEEGETLEGIKAKLKPKKKIGIPTDSPNRIGTNCTRTIIDSIKLVPKLSIILLNLMVSSCTLCAAPSIVLALSYTL